MSTDKAQAWRYAEEYIEEGELIASTRELGIDVGAEPVSPGVGATLRMLTAVAGARAVLEIGTGVGVSGLYLLSGMASDGVLTTIDPEPEFHKHARRAFAAAGIASQRTRLISGAALDVLPRMANGGYDMMVIDAAIHEIPDYLDHALRVVRPGGCVVIVHALWHDRVADPTRRDADTVVMREVGRFLSQSEEFMPALLPVGDGVAVAVRR